MMDILLDELNENDERNNGSNSIFIIIQLDGMIMTGKRMATTIEFVNMSD